MKCPLRDYVLSSVSLHIFVHPKVRLLVAVTTGGGSGRGVSDDMDVQEPGYAAGTGMDTCLPYLVKHGEGEDCH